MFGFNVEVFNQYQEDEEILVDDVNLHEYLQDTKQTKHELLRNEMFLITQMFDHRIRCFIKHILMDQGDEGMHVHYFTYRVEFQMRGLPHIHGVAWMDKEFLEPYMMEDGFTYDLDKLPELVDRFVTCEIPEEPHMKKLVEDLQTHSHSKSCKKKGVDCRFDNPKLPSNRTLIARVKDKDDDNDSSISLEKSKEIKKQVRFIFASFICRYSQSINYFPRSKSFSARIQKPRIFI